MTKARGKLARADWQGVWGWALDAFSNSGTALIDVLVDGEVVGTVVANRPRPQFTTLPPEKRNCGFQLLFATGLSALVNHEIRARWADSGADLPGSPVLLEAAHAGDAPVAETLGDAVQAAIASATAPSDLDPSLRFVGDQIERLLALRRQASGEDGPPTHLAELQQRWSAMGAGSPDPVSTAAGTGGRRALLIAEAPAERGMEDPALLGQIASLTRLGLRVDYVAADFPTQLLGDFGAQRAAIEAAGAVYRCPPFDLSAEDVLKRERGLYDVVVLQGIACYERYAALVRHYCRRARLVFNVDTLAFLVMARRGIVQQWQAGIDASRGLRLRDMMATWSADVTTTYSAVEARALRESVPQARIQVVGWKVESPGPGRPFQERGGIVFVGDFRQFADVDAAVFLASQVMPLIRAADPGIACRVGGTPIPAALRTRPADGVSLVEQPARVAALAAEARVAVAPIRAGGGLSRFVVESLACGTPCVASSVAVEAITLPPELAALVSDDPAELAATVCRLYRDEAAWAALADAGRRFAAEHFSAAATDRSWQQVIGVPAPAEPPEAAA